MLGKDLEWGCSMNLGPVFDSHLTENPPSLNNHSPYQCWVVFSFLFFCEKLWYQFSHNILRIELILFKKSPLKKTIKSIFVPIFTNLKNQSILKGDSHDRLSTVQFFNKFSNNYLQQEKGAATQMKLNNNAIGVNSSNTTRTMNSNNIKGLSSNARGSKQQHKRIEQQCKRTQATTQEESNIITKGAKLAKNISQHLFTKEIFVDYWSSCTKKIWQTNIM